MSALRHPPVLGGLLGVAVALLFVAVVTAFAGRTEIWWWPAVAVAGVIGGGVLGSVLGAEAEGEPPDEAYEGGRARD